MKYLLDTCLLSELVRPAPAASVLAWMEKQSSLNLFMSAMTLAELHRGVAKLPLSRRREELAQWLQRVELGFEDRILAFTKDTATIWAQMCAQVETKGRTMGMMDSTIAATAMEHGLTLITRNTSDFDQAPILVVNPWQTVA